MKFENAMEKQTRQAPPDTLDEGRKEGFARALKAIVEHGAHIEIAPRVELCDLRAHEDLNDPEQENARVSVRFDALPGNARKICRLAASLSRLTLAAPLFVTSESHDVRRTWYLKLFDLPDIGPYAKLLYSGNALRRNAVANFDSIFRALRRSVVEGEGVPADVARDIGAAVDRWQCPDMDGYDSKPDEEKIVTGRYVREHAQQLLEILTR